jgi:hypothetical protein
MKNPLIFLLALLPFAAALFYAQSKLQTLNAFEEAVITAHKKARIIEERKEKNSRILSEIKKSDPFYIDTHLEKLSFLEDEARRVQALSMHQKDNSILQRRLDFLRSGENKIIFTEGARHQEKGFQEVEEKMQHPLEMNEDDLKKLLVLIEGVTINSYSPKQGRPQLVITDFDLTKHRSPSDEEVYVVDLKLIKREK